MYNGDINKLSLKNMDNEDLISALAIIVIILGVIGAVGFGIAQPYFEAKQFNECTGGNATYTTAWFTELRIQECNK